MTTLIIVAGATLAICIVILMKRNEPTYWTLYNFSPEGDNGDPGILHNSNDSIYTNRYVSSRNKTEQEGRFNTGILPVPYERAQGKQRNKVYIPERKVRVDMSKPPQTGSTSLNKPLDEEGVPSVPVRRVVRPDTVRIYPATPMIFPGPKEPTKRARVRADTVIDSSIPLRMSTIAAAHESVELSRVRHTESISEKAQDILLKKLSSLLCTSSCTGPSTSISTSGTTTYHCSCRAINNHMAHFLPGEKGGISEKAQ